MCSSDLGVDLAEELVELACGDEGLERGIDVPARPEGADVEQHRQDGNDDDGDDQGDMDPPPPTWHTVCLTFNRSLCLSAFRLLNKLSKTLRL